MIRRFPGFLLLALLMWVPKHAAAYAEMVVFGDSLSDSGNVLALTTALAATDARYRPDPPPGAYFEGRASNGLNYADQLAVLLGLPIPPASLAGGTNYAYAGSKTGFGTNVRFPSPTFPLNPPVDVVRTGSQIDAYLADRGAFNADQLVVLWSGANDLRDAAGPADIVAIVNNLGAHLRALAASGAKHVLVPNQLDSSLIPFIQLPGPPDPAAIRAGIVLFNTLLARTLDAVEQETAIDIMPLDLFALSLAVDANPQAFGFTNKTDPALRFNPANGSFSVVPNPEDYVFWDLVHPTAKFHALLANAALAVVPAPGSVWLILFCLVILAVSRVQKQRRCA